MSWTDDEIEQVKADAAAGMSAGQIGERHGRTRAAIIGKLHRLGIALRGFSPFWTKKLDERLMKLHIAGFHNAAIAEQLGATRHAVSNRLGRLRGTGARGAQRGQPVMNRPVNVKPQVQSMPLQETAVTSDKNVKFTDLRDHHCRWIEGLAAGVDTVYCGAQTLHDSSWCREHFRAAHAR